MLRLNRILYEEAINFGPFKVPCQNFLGGTDIYHGNPQTGETIYWPKSEPGTF
jgi:hypothetical protein